MLKTPVLLIIFNRPDVTLRVFEVIRKAQPSKLYIAADGPRENKIGEKEKCIEARGVINDIDWPCEVQTLFQEKNLGCKWGPITAIDWLFKNEEQGIILEDDCLPDLSFFNFCTKLLDYYRNNLEVMHISGNNFQKGILRGDASYYFSKYSHSWGWATWRRAWNTFHPSLEQFEKFDKDDLIKKVPISKKAQEFWIKNFRQTIKGNDSWDSLWMYTLWYNDGLAVLPQKNLVKNIGFGEDATHTKEEKSLINTEIFSIEEINYKKEISQDKAADEYTFKSLYYKPFHTKVILKIKQMLKI